ncbi:hypothetical protein FHS07_001997 [Microbacterium proteolyticum]|uniref:Uncharacterized protein n=1 Tax=Microbacterium proteolyticum TaxID=1572644 RepID=A0A7W5CIJ4_9MICO|nr:hypothetical protein [Microbacterium proteolyticum]MBB3158301.1 hypothetical protein [Microbacterium proteolyticum]
MTGVEVREPTARRAGGVVVTIGGVTMDLDVEAAFDLQRKILSAVVHLERAQRGIAAKSKVKTAREIRRATQVDETLRDREGGR